MEVHQVEQCLCVKIRTTYGRNAGGCHVELCGTFANHALLYSVLERWVQEFWVCSAPIFVTGLTNEKDCCCVGTP